jgi:hypothetical protein
VNTPEWQPADTIPKDGTCVLALTPISTTPVVIRWSGQLGTWVVAWDGYKIGPLDQPTLWAPLPDA